MDVHRPGAKQQTPIVINTGIVKHFQSMGVYGLGYALRFSVLRHQEFEIVEYMRDKGVPNISAVE